MQLHVPTRQQIEQMATLRARRNCEAIVEQAKYNVPGT